MQYRRNEVPESQSAVFAHVTQDEGRQNVTAQLKAHFEEGVPQSLSLEDASLFLGVVLEGGLPVFEAAHQILEVAEFQATAARRLQRLVHNGTAITSRVSKHLRQR